MVNFQAALICNKPPPRANLDRVDVVITALPSFSHWSIQLFLLAFWNFPHHVYSCDSSRGSLNTSAIPPSRCGSSTFFQSDLRRFFCLS